MRDHVSLVDYAGLSDSAPTVSQVSQGVDVASRVTARNSPNVNITVDEVEDDDDDDNQVSLGLNPASRDATIRSTVRNSPEVNISVDEVADDDDDEQDGEEVIPTPYTSSNTTSNDGTSSVGSVEYVEYVTDPQSIVATPSMDFVRKLDTSTPNDVYTYASPQLNQSHRITVHKKTWYHLETIEEVLSPIADTVELPPTFTNTVSKQQTDSLHKHFPLLVVESVKDGDDMGDLPLSLVA